MKDEEHYNQNQRPRAASVNAHGLRPVGWHRRNTRNGTGRYRVEPLGGIAHLWQHCLAGGLARRLIAPSSRAKEYLERIVEPRAPADRSRPALGVLNRNTLELNPESSIPCNIHWSIESAPCEPAFGG